MITHTGPNIGKDMMRCHALLDITDNGGYNPKLYIKSKHVFQLAPDHIKQAIVNFNKQIQHYLFVLRQQKPKPNLTPLRSNLMQYVKDTNIYIIVHEDKNLGPCILKR